MQAWHDALMIWALESTKSNFVGMQIQLDKTIIEMKSIAINSLPFRTSCPLFRLI
jgi:hypothetical protein